MEEVRVKQQNARSRGIRAGTQYVDVGTLQGSPGALAMLAANGIGHEKAKVFHA